MIYIDITLCIHIFMHMALECNWTITGTFGSTQEISTYVEIDVPFHISFSGKKKHMGCPPVK